MTKEHLERAGLVRENALPAVRSSGTHVETALVPDVLRRDLSRAVSILKAEGCSEIFLFGSAAGGKLNSDSDIDLAIRGCPPGHFFRVLGRLLWELDRPVDLVDLDSQDPFALHLQREVLLVRVT